MVSASKSIRLRDMMAVGLLVDLVCIPLVWAAVKAVPLVFR